MIDTAKLGQFDGRLRCVHHQNTQGLKSQGLTRNVKLLQLADHRRIGGVINELAKNSACICAIRKNSNPI